MMVATRETLRSWFYRPWFLAMIAAVLSASLLIAGGVFVAMRQVEQSESQQMNAQGERFLARLEQLFGQLRESLDDLEAQPLRSCDDEMIATLQQVTFNYRFVYEAAYMDGSRICSNRPRQEGLSMIRPPDIKDPGYSYWLNTSTEPDENRAALMLGRGNFRVATSRGHLTDMVDLTPGSSLLVILDHGNGFLSLYGHNQTLLKSAGDVVKAGESISTVGNSGGQDTPALYFAIRQQGHPSDPAQWCRAQG